MTRVVGIVDYGAGNIQSIENAFDYVGAAVRRIRSGEELAGCTHAVLPGVGAFGFCAERLQASGLIPDLRSWALEKGKPLLGICVGMQLLGDRSDESPGIAGLGWIGGEVRRLGGGPGVRVPHVGWNSVHFQHAFGTFAPGDAADFYFDHSFAYDEPREGRAVGQCLHGVSFNAVLERRNIVAAQFHPEKSQSAGLRFLESFLSR